MKTKLIKIKDLKPGMRIKSYDQTTHEVVYKEVTDVWETEVKTEDQRHVFFANGTDLKCSKNHPIMVCRQGVVEQVLPDDLLPEHQVISEYGLTNVTRVDAGDRKIQHIDITVEDSHVFFASSGLEDEQILTHNSQGGVRGGAATLYYPIWHLEIEDMLVLKNNKGTDETRVRHMDYGVQFNKLMYERLLNGGDITLFSPHDLPEMYDAFFNDQEKFKELYERAERNTRIRKKTIKAIDLFKAFAQERKDTGRVYLMNVDHANTHGSFDETVAPIRQSNLCCEINLPTKPLKDINDPDGEISLCTLSAINWGVIKDFKQMEKVCDLAVRGLDELLDYQHYPVLAAKLSTMNRRPLGIGIINFAYWLAKHGSTYQNPDLTLVDEWAEAWSYFLIKASADLAVEKGACPSNMETKYGNGITPNQTYKKDLDELVPNLERMDWQSLREQLSTTGIRNSTLMSLMPAETSAQISNSTNGIEPPRSFISVKGSKHGQLKQVVPGYPRLKNKYDLLWDQKSPEGYLKICAVLQKYIDQGISVNTSYNPEHYPDEEIPMSVLLKDLLMFYKYGGKQLYYNNTYDGHGEIDTHVVREAVMSQSIIQDNSPCDSCTI